MSGRSSAAYAAHALWERGRRAWPELDVPFDAFADHLARRLGGEAPPHLTGELCAEDLYLAVACGRGSGAAAAAFEERFVPTIDRSIARMRADAAASDELRQSILVRLLVPDALGAEPRIGQYSGRGPLAAWVSIAAGRAALNARRDDRETPSGSVEDVLADRALAALRDPELDLIRQRYRGAFASALGRALAALGRDHRSLLRLHYVDSLTMDGLAGLFGISRAGAHRRLASAREALFDGTCAILRRELALDTTELESLLRLVKSDLDLDLPDLLRDPPPDG